MKFPYLTTHWQHVCDEHFKFYKVVQRHHLGKMENVYKILQQIYSGNHTPNFITIARVVQSLQKTFWPLFSQTQCRSRVSDGCRNRKCAVFFHPDMNAFPNLALEPSVTDGHIKGRLSRLSSPDNSKIFVEDTTSFTFHVHYNRPSPHECATKKNVYSHQHSLPTSDSTFSANK